jgi:MFS family permease
MTIEETLQTRVRATRRATSIPLIVVSLGVILVALSPLVGARFEVGMFIAPVVAIALWVSMKTTAVRAGVGMGRERYGLIVIVVALVSTMWMIQLTLGPAFLLGVLLFVVGWRSHDRVQWAAGVIIAVVSPILNYSLLQTLVYRIEEALTGGFWVTDMAADDVALLLLGVFILASGLRRFGRESVTIRRRSS